MISAVAFCPHPPLIVPAVAQGAATELDDLRAACRTAIRRMAAASSQILVIGSGERWRQHAPTARGSLAPYGVPVEIALGSDEAGRVELPLSLTIGAWLLRDALGANCGASGWSVGPDDRFADMEPPFDETPRGLLVMGDGIEPPFGETPRGLLVMGDGSARRGRSAPGYLDDRAAGYDNLIATALRTGEPDMLHIHLPLADQLLAAGARAWDAAAWELEGPSWDAELLYDAAPYGVGYFVAAWTRRA